MKNTGFNPRTKAGRVLRTKELINQLQEKKGVNHNKVIALRIKLANI